MVKRKYLLVGITGLTVMAPLAVTSTNAMIKRLGGKRWRALHRLAYVAAVAGVIHYYMQVKADVRQPLPSPPCSPSSSAGGWGTPGVPPSRPPPRRRQTLTLTASKFNSGRGKKSRTLRAVCFLDNPPSGSNSIP